MSNISDHAEKRMRKRLGLSKSSVEKAFGEKILVELKRNRELLDLYKNLPGGAGVFGARFIEMDIDAAERALAINDMVKILQSYKKLKGNE